MRTRPAPRPAHGGQAEMVAVGSVLRAHGLRGEVLVLPDSENPARFQSGSELFVREGARRRRLQVASSRLHRGRELVRFVDVRDRDGAEALRGALLEAPEETVPAAEEGTFYYFELVGCRVVDRYLGDLGEVTEVVEDGGGVLLSVTLSAGGGRGSDGRRGGVGGAVLIPFANQLLPEIHVEERLIRSDLPKGLLEACASTS